MRLLVRYVARHARQVAIAACVAAVLVVSRRVESRATVEQGAALFATNCAQCHGENGTGGRGPDLTRATLRFASDDPSLFRVIASGIPGSAMPGFMAGHSSEDLWQLVAYVRSLAPTLGSAPDGDSDAGRRLFEGRAACATCHLVHGRGGFRGPDLSDITRLRTPSALRETIAEPSHQASAAWRSLRATTLDGRVITGRRLDEDTFSVRLLDAGGRLWNIERRQTRSIERITASAMPRYGSALTAGEIDDIVAYLATAGN